MSVLVFAGDPWHPVESLQEGLVGLQPFGFDFSWTENVDDVDTAHLGEHAIIVLAKANFTPTDTDAPWMSQSMQQSFTDFVREGGGLLVLHSGAAGYADASTLRRLMGGVFCGHPEPCPVRFQPVASHPIARKCEAFESVDEQYAMKLEDDGAEIFLVTESEHGSQPAGWLRHEGEGRVCILTPGHNADVWSHPSYQKLLLNALRWSGGGAVA